MYWVDPASRRQSPPEPEVWCSESEPIVTFFLRLPETVSLPSETPMPEIRKIDPPLYHRLLGWEHDAGSVGKTERSQGDRQGRVNLINAHVMTGSLFLRRVSIDMAEVLGLNATMEALSRAQPDSSASPAASALASSPSGMDDSKLGGTCTVAEVAVPLQIMVALQESDWSGEDQPPLPGEQDIDEELLGAAFDSALAHVRRVQSLYHAITRVPITLLTPELLPPFVPYLIRTSKQIAEGVVVEPGFFPVNFSVGHVVQEPDLEPEQVEGMFRTGERGETLMIYLDLHRQASVALYTHGNTREAVVMVAAAAEAMLNIVLAHMRWEEGMTPEASAKTWPDGLMTRVKTMFNARLGGTWDPTASGPVGRWAQDVAALRNRVVHAGYTPTRDDAGLAMTAVEELLEYLGDRLTYGRNLRRYPRTASEFLRETGLRKRDRFPRWLQDLQQDPAEPLWCANFARWYQAQTRLLADNDVLRKPSLEASNVVAVIRCKGEYHWVAHEPITRQAAEAHVVLAVGVGDPLNTFVDLLEVAEGGHAPDYPISLAFDRGGVVKLERTGPWVEEYHLIPPGVMFDSSDFEAPWPLA